MLPVGNAWPVQGNAMFAVVLKRIIPKLQTRAFFYIWAEHDAERAVVRWMCSWDTTEEDVDSFVASVAEVMGQK